MEKIKVIGKALVAGVAFWLFFRYVARFSSDQSLALTVVAWFFYLKLRESQPEYFEPHWVSIRPKWYELLLDHNLVRDLEEWKRILAGLNVPASDYNVLRDGITFTVLKPANLIYRDDRKKFSRDADFEEKIPGLTFRTSGGGQASVRVRVGIGDERIGLLGYEVRITAPDSADQVERDERGHIRVAFLPREAFCFYSEDKGKFSEKRWTRLRATQEKLLETNGWKLEDDTTPYDIVEVPDRIEHKYFTVWHKRI